MKRMLCAAALLCMMMTALSGCGAPDVSGRWVSEDVGYYLELDRDGSCQMFDQDDTLASWGTYQATGSTITFFLDTGTFTWVRDGDRMTFETGEKTYAYVRQ